MRGQRGSAARGAGAPVETGTGAACGPVRRSDGTFQTLQTGEREVPPRGEGRGARTDSRPITVTGLAAPKI